MYVVTLLDEITLAVVNAYTLAAARFEEAWELANLHCPPGAFVGLAAAQTPALALAA